MYTHLDGLGNVIALTDEAQTARRVYAYDDWRVVQGQIFVQRFGYSAAGLLDTVTVTGPGGMAFQGRKYLHDEAQGILTGIRLGGALTQFTTDGNANPTGITFPAGERRRS